MLTNIELFNYSKDNPEELLDPFYEKGILVIPERRNQRNLLVSRNERLIDLITSFNTLHARYKKDLGDDLIQNIIHDIVGILDSTPNINYSAFVQFFMVYNSTYSIYKSLSNDQKVLFVYEMLKKYCAERHKVYSNHGYSDIVLQVVCDNYSHKRNSKTSIDKVLSFLDTDDHFMEYLRQEKNLLERDDFYFLPDKGDKKLFEYLLKAMDIKMESRGIEHNKLPDLVFKHNGNYYICELKTMKGEGGGQNKQLVEIAYFIKFAEENPNVHYLVFLDCNYSNMLFSDTSPKIANQRQDIMKALENNPGNYFLNTKGMLKFIKDLFS